MGKKWTPETIEKELRDITKELNHFPTYHELNSSRTNLVSGIGKNGGYRKYQMLITGKYSIKPNNYWKNKENIILELKILIDRLGRFPTTKEMGAVLRSVVYEYHGGINTFRKQMGFETYAEHKENGYWTKETVIKEILEYIDVNGEFPLTGNTHLTYAINKFGGQKYFRKILNYPIKRPKYKWDDINVFLNIIKKEFSEFVKNGIFPTKKILRSKIGGLDKALKKFGDIKEIAKLLNCRTDCFVSSDGHYLSSGNELLFDEFLYANNISHEANGRICDEYNYRYDFKIGDNYIEIWGYSKKDSDKMCLDYNKKRKIKEEIYNKLGLNLISVEKDIFVKTHEAIENHFKEVIKRCNSIEVYNFAENSIKNHIKHARYWNEETIIKELCLIIEKIGKFPSFKWLAKNNRNDLCGGIAKNGGMLNFRKLMGFIEIPKKQKFWTKERILKSLKELSGVLGRYPKISEMPSDLYSAISKIGGINLFRKELGY